MAALLDSVLVLVGGRFGAKHHRFLAMLGLREDGVGVGEIDDGKGIGVRYIGSYRPLRDQHRGANLVIVVAKETDIDLEVVDKVGEHPLTHLDGGGCIRRHQLGRDGGDYQIKAARHVYSNTSVQTRVMR